MGENRADLLPEHVRTMSASTLALSLVGLGAGVAALAKVVFDFFHVGEDTISPKMAFFLDHLLIVGIFSCLCIFCIVRIFEERRVFLIELRKSEASQKDAIERLHRIHRDEIEKEKLKSSTAWRSSRELKAAVSGVVEAGRPIHKFFHKVRNLNYLINVHRINAHWDRKTEVYSQVSDELKIILTEVSACFTALCTERVNACIKIVSTQQQPRAIYTLARDDTSSRERQRLDEYIENNNKNLLSSNTQFEELFRDGEPWLLKFNTLQEFREKGYTTAAMDGWKGIGVTTPPFESLMYAAIALNQKAYDPEAKNAYVVRGFIYLDSPKKSAFSASHAELLSAMADTLYFMLDNFVSYLDECSRHSPSRQPFGGVGKS